MEDETNISVADRSRVDHRPFQYSLRTLLMMMTTAAAVCSVAFAPTNFILVWDSLSLIVLLTVAWTVMLIYGRGHRRTFAIGALFPLGAVFLVAAIHAAVSPEWLWDHQNIVNVHANFQLFGMPVPIAMLGSVCLSLLAGVVAMIVRWIVESSGKSS